MKLTSLKEIVDYFDLKADETRKDDIRSELKQLLAEKHPDKSGGKFTSENQEKRFNEIQDAIKTLTA